LLKHFLPKPETLLPAALLLTGLLSFPPFVIQESPAEEELPARLFFKALPLNRRQTSALSYHEIAINSSDPRHNNPLVNLSDYGIAGKAFYSRLDGLNAPYHRCICPESSVMKSRKLVAEKLKKVNARLAPLGLELYVFDAYRPVSCQRELWDYFLAEARRIVGSSEQSRLIEYAGKYCSNPTAYDPHNYKTWPTHLTGGAVDLTLKDRHSGELLYMGSIFDEASSLASTSYFEEPSRSEPDPLTKPGSVKTQGSPGPDARAASDIEAMRNRRLLYWVMQAEGFANYPNEWWHFDFGNQMWVQNRQDNQTETAFFGAI
jgi:zinc D-Ala-D-Ala dipeptidase